MPSAVTIDREQGTFALPVDSEHKATAFPIFSVAKPHMRAFHLSWLQFFSCFVSSFAAAPLLPIIRDNLNLTATSIGDAGIAAVSGAVFSRIAMGAACDLVGPRVASAWITLLTAPAVYCSSIANSAISFLLVRFFTGFALATFISTQFWMTSMFSPPIVGLANGLASGWGDLGGCATQLIMPLVYDLIIRFGVTNFTAWRIAFFIPAILQTMTAYAVMIFGQDTPDGNFRGLQKFGMKHRDKFSKVFFHGIRNYRAWLAALCYGYSFGVVLTMNNIISQFFYDRFDLTVYDAGIIAASFGLTNIFAQPGGGVLSDILGRRFGMRGRLWGWWIFQTLGGVLCILLGRAGSLGASVAMMLLLSIFVQASCSLTFGVVAFVSRRAMGVISGIMGGGGNIGAILIQVIFFKGSKISTEMGITYMGMMVIVCTLPIAVIYFPQWGGMIRGPKPNYTEQDYYLSEWTEEEQQQGFHETSMKFAENSKSERYRKIDFVFSPTEIATPTHV